MPRLDDVMWRLVQGMTTRRVAVVIIMVKEYLTDCQASYHSTADRQKEEDEDGGFWIQKNDINHYR